jgi:hypothetical protein
MAMATPSAFRREIPLGPPVVSALVNFIVGLSFI